MSEEGTAGKDPRANGAAEAPEHRDATGAPSAGQADCSLQSLSRLLYLRGLPWGTKHEVTLVNGLGGKPTGEAYIRLSTTEDLDKIIKDYNMQLIGRRYIELFKANEQEMKSHVEQTGVSDFSSGLVRVRGLPFTFMATDVVDLFASFNISEDQVIIGMHTVGPFAGSTNGEALVKLGDEATAKKALAELNMTIVGQRYIELYLMTEAERVNFKVPPRERDDGSLSSRAATCLLRARGLPFSSSSTEVAEFFKGYSVEPQHVLLLVGYDGRPTGEALVWLPDAATAVAARKALHGRLMGKRYVELFPPGPADVANAVAAVSGAVVLPYPYGMQASSAMAPHAMAPHGQHAWAYPGGAFCNLPYPVDAVSTGSYYATPEVVYSINGMTSPYQASFPGLSYVAAGIAASEAQEAEPTGSDAPEALSTQ
eukprot:TRINITY_DN26601_c0_g1_i2.p1 TRINITY_DN26601_c0_g1~~TRINITY_DN26601_c0_g1_i2.p1  ORF type:complete len:426 (-),score=79.89 TRINITY_DN26601_c0_g1_i2:56-1333(-)